MGFRNPITSLSADAVTSGAFSGSYTLPGLLTVGTPGAARVEIGSNGTDRGVRLYGPDGETVMVDLDADTGDGTFTGMVQTSAPGGGHRGVLLPGGTVGPYATGLYLDVGEDFDDAAHVVVNSGTLEILGFGGASISLGSASLTAPIQIHGDNVTITGDDSITVSRPLELLVPYTPLVLSSPWADAGGNTAAGYYQTADGMVHLVGRIGAATAVSGTPVILGTGGIPSALAPDPRVDIDVIVQVGNNYYPARAAAFASGSLLLSFFPQMPTTITGLSLSGISWYPGL